VTKFVVSTRAESCRTDGVDIGGATCNIEYYINTHDTDTTRQVDELNACWNNVIRRLFGYNKWESVSALLLLLERLNVKHLIMLRKINFYKRLLYSSDVFIIP